MTTASAKSRSKDGDSTPRTPIPRLARPTSNWNGLPFGHPMESATGPGMTMWPEPQMIAFTPTTQTSALAKVAGRNPSVPDCAYWTISAMTKPTTPT